MFTIEAAIDDYFHTIIRSRPWTKKREEEVLTAFSDWLYEQPDTSFQASDVNVQLVQQYVNDCGLSFIEQQELLTALHNLYTWATYYQRLDINPFTNPAAN